MRDCVCAQSLSRVPLGNPMHASLPAPLSMGFPRQEYLSGLPFSTPGDLPKPGIEPVSHVSCIGRFFTTVLPGKPNERLRPPEFSFLLERGFFPPALFLRDSKITVLIITFNKI